MKLHDLPGAVIIRLGALELQDDDCCNRTMGGTMLCDGINWEALSDGLGRRRRQFTEIHASDEGWSMLIGYARCLGMGYSATLDRTSSRSLVQHLKYEHIGRSYANIMRTQYEDA